MNLGDNLKKIRKDNNLSQEQLAEKLGVSRQSVSKWESNQAYPEMDKMLQLCQLFNLNIDDLLNQDIKEINNNKQAKNNINKYIDDFLEYITKTIDMFSNMKFKQKIKCILEQIIISISLFIIIGVIGMFGENILYNLFSFMPEKIFYPIYCILESLYLLASLILSLILILYIFKVRYLDYYIIVESDKETEKDIEINTEKEMKKDSKIVLESNKEKIVIRDPKHSSYKFISGLLKSLLIIIKAVVSLISTVFCFSLIMLVLFMVISFLFIKTGIFFMGILILLLSLIIINLIILIIFYNFIISQKIKKNKLAISFLISLISFGIGVGLIIIGITKFDIITDVNTKYYKTSEIIVDYNDKLYFNNYYGKINYVESNNQNVKIVYKHSKYFDINMEISEGYYFYPILNNKNEFEIIRDSIKLINDKKIIDYAQFEINIYTTKENIEKIKNNSNYYYFNQDGYICTKYK